MSIDIQTEQTFSFAQAAKLNIWPYRRNGKRPNSSTIWRWALHGVRGVRLESIVAGGVRVTSTEAIQRFFDQLTEKAEANRSMPVIPPPQRLTAARRKQIEAAERKLAEAGI